MIYLGFVIWITEREAGNSDLLGSSSLLLELFFDHGGLMRIRVIEDQSVSAEEKEEK